MDRTPEEKQAVMLVTAQLLKHGVLVANPLFDQLGGDLLGLTVAGEKAALCRIQVKYRDCTNDNAVVIPLEYVTGAFVLFMNLKTKMGDTIVCLFPNEIKKYAKLGKSNGKDVYRFGLTEKLVAVLVADATLNFDAQKGANLKSLTQESSAAAAMYKEFLEISATAATLIEAQERLIRFQRVMQQIEVTKAKKEATDQTLVLLNEALDKLKEKMVGGDENQQDD